MRIVGAILLVAACTLFGAGQAKKLYFHKSCLESFLDALRYIDAELKNASMAVPEIFSELSLRKEWKLENFFSELSGKMSDFGEESLAKIWTGCVMEDKSVELTLQERQEIVRVGNYLGKFSENEQSEAIQACIRHLEDELEKLSLRAKERAKLYTGLGVTAGLMLATVLF